MNPKEQVEQDLRAWADERKVDKRRDDLIIQALDAGVTINRIHVLTGISRGTIYRTIAASGFRRS